MGRPVRSEADHVPPNQPSDSASDLPDGQISSRARKPVHPFLQKYFACAVGQITATSFSRPAPERGAYAQSPRTLGAGCDGRVGVARRAIQARTAKSCGPGIPTLVSSLRMIEPQATVAKEPGHRGEHEISSKTIARGRPGELAEPVVTTLVCFVLFCTRGCGCIERPAFPAPSYSRGWSVQQLGRDA